MGNGLACQDRCEEQVKLLNQLVSKSASMLTKSESVLAKSANALQTTSKTYTRYGLVCLLFGIVFLILGIIFIFSKTAVIASIFLPFGHIMLLAAFASYSAGQKLRDQP